MGKIKSCEYNNDNDTITAIKTDGSKVSILCAAVEDSLNTTMTTRSKLVWLKENEPSTYTELVLDGKIQQFLNDVDKSHHQIEINIKQQLTPKFGENIAGQIAREFIMYDS
ncbi:MAG: hypothetical protein FIA99_05670 [Ruminiclostridium sp.]|nr:hypothetical protein [Ruminiclostridium sp.]